MLSYNVVQKMNRFIQIVIVLCFVGCVDRELAKSKEEWSHLQSLEHQNRDKAVKEFTVINYYGDSYFCIDGVSSNRIWVMAFPKSSPYYKQMPVEDYSISKGEFEYIKDKVDLSETVQLVLESHVEE